MQITLEFKSKADAQLAIALLATTGIKWRIVDIDEQEKEKRDVPLITEERW